MDTRFINHTNPGQDIVIHLAGCSLAISATSLDLCTGPTSTIALRPGDSFSIEAGRGIPPPRGWELFHTIIFGGPGDCASAASRCNAIIPSLGGSFLITVEYEWDCRSIVLCEPLDNTGAAGDEGDNTP